MKLIKNIKDVQIQTPPYFILSYSYEEIYLWEIGYQHLCSLENSVHILKDMHTNEIFKVTENVFKHLLSIGESINNSY